MESIRPKSVTIISWLTISVGCLNLFNVTRMPEIFRNPEYQKLAEATGLSMNLGLAMVTTGIAASVLLVSGIAMLKGLNWGRLLYLWGQGVNILYGVIVVVMAGRFTWVLALPGVIVYAIFMFFLTRPEVTDYFIGESSAAPALQNVSAGIQDSQQAHTETGWGRPQEMARPVKSADPAEIKMFIRQTFDPLFLSLGLSALPEGPSVTNKELVCGYLKDEIGIQISVDLHDFFPYLMLVKPKNNTIPVDYKDALGKRSKVYLQTALKELEIDCSAEMKELQGLSGNYVNCSKAMDILARLLEKHWPSVQTHLGEIFK